MNTILLFAALATVLAALIVSGAYLAFGRGLALRMFLVMFTLLAAIAIGAFSIAHFGLSVATFSVAGAICVPIAVIGVVYIYRSIVVHLTNEADKLTVNSSQLAATARESAMTASEQAATVSQMSTVSAEGARAVVQVGTQAVDKGRATVTAVEEAKRTMQLIGGRRRASGAQLLGVGI